MLQEWGKARQKFELLQSAPARTKSLTYGTQNTNVLYASPLGFGLPFTPTLTYKLQL